MPQSNRGRTGLYVTERLAGSSCSVGYVACADGNIAPACAKGTHPGKRFSPGRPRRGGTADRRGPPVVANKIGEQGCHNPHRGRRILSAYIFNDELDAHGVVLSLDYGSDLSIDFKVDDDVMVVQRVK